MTPLQEHIYQILEVTDRFCKEHNIPYFFTFGTVIGTLRHKGFIPWDDDADIGMLRPDFERFLKLAATKLPENFALQNFRMGKGIPLPLARIVDTRARLVIPDDGSHLNRKHVYLDVFCVDNVSEHALKRRIQTACLSFVNSLFEVKYVNVPAPRWRNKMLVRFARPLLPVRILLGIYDWLVAWNGQRETKMVWIIASPYHAERTVYPREWVARQRRAPFERGEFLIPVKAELCMEKTYGDYMTPPPPEQRVTHGMELLQE